jgi:hypothetical protein
MVVIIIIIIIIIIITTTIINIIIMFGISGSLFNAVVSLKTCIREILGSNVGPDSDYNASGFS